MVANGLLIRGRSLDLRGRARLLMCLFYMPSVFSICLFYVNHLENSTNDKIMKKAGANMGFYKICMERVRYSHINFT